MDIRVPLTTRSEALWRETSMFSAMNVELANPSRIKIIGGDGHRDHRENIEECQLRALSSVVRANTFSFTVLAS
ncbi:hypothetical protein BD410DRAFT_789163 [Rickenella mellea]|uniref:Uncharacterized protein n=1 Tax=Rickenella mellea TaxID=50990 RepID=A0A4Y7Q295_9AGAM|nr:hypothetical protein BD410DRAFT_789163 [Rickenella mellea]